VETALYEGERMLDNLRRPRRGGAESPPIHYWSQQAFANPLLATNLALLKGEKWKLKTFFD